MGFPAKTYRPLTFRCSRVNDVSAEGVGSNLPAARENLTLFERGTSLAQSIAKSHPSQATYAQTLMKRASNGIKVLKSATKPHEDYQLPSTPSPNPVVQAVAAKVPAPPSVEQAKAPAQPSAKPSKVPVKSLPRETVAL